jgi:dTDP-4-amino-4,6-dideoxygalactose transaminase
MNIDPAEVERRLTARTRAILPVHFAGRPCAMDELLALAREHDLLVIEDCAHAIETAYRGRPAGTMGDFGCFSFYVTKNMTTGEGGMVLGRRQEALDRIKMLALHGLSRDAWKRFGDEGHRHYHVVDAGFKCNMMDLQAAIGIHQLARVEGNREIRQAIWERYQSAFADLPLTLPAPTEEYERHSYHLFTVLVDEKCCGIDRDGFLDGMTARNIGVGVHYLSVPEHPSYQQRFGWNSREWPNAARIGRTTVSLPLSPALTDEDVEDVIATVRALVG